MRHYLAAAVLISAGLIASAHAQPSTNGPSGTGPEGSPPGVVSGSGLNPGSFTAPGASPKVAKKQTKKSHRHK
jgi:hypothetical protein